MGARLISDVGARASLEPHHGETRRDDTSFGSQNNKDGRRFESHPSGSQDGTNNAIPSWWILNQTAMAPDGRWTGFYGRWRSHPPERLAAVNQRKPLGGGPWRPEEPHGPPGFTTGEIDRGWALRPLQLITHVWVLYQVEPDGSWLAETQYAPPHPVAEVIEALAPTWAATWADLVAAAELLEPVQGQEPG